MRPEVRKLLWRSRRGMLELDTLFREYLLRYGEKMNEQQIREFESLLELQDQTLYEAFSGQQALQNAEHQRLLIDVMQASRA